MKNSDFVEPIIYYPNVNVSKREMLTILKEQLTPESTAWLASLMNETVFSPDEVGQFGEFIIRCCYPEPNVVDYQNNSKNLDICKPMLLFDKMFFPELQEAFYPFNYLDAEKKAKFYLTDHLNTERIKYIPLLFTKINNIDTFYPWVEKIIEAIKIFCTQNEEFAQAYRAKLEEIWNTYGSLRGRLALYVNSDTEFIRELEQPSFEMLRKYFTDSDNHNDLLTDSSSHEDLLVTLLFISLLQPI